ncbi:MAG: hypothetical protein COA36_12825 [Desulfotalea sp.]|nr:MAG: hypothetical protein COA36_12825 [Desulfotalea sp.]
MRILVIDDQIGCSEEEQSIFLRAIGELTGYREDRQLLGRYDVTFCSGQRIIDEEVHNDVASVLEAVASVAHWALILLDMQFDSGSIGKSKKGGGQPGDEFFGLQVERKLYERFRNLPLIRFTSKSEQEIREESRPYLAKLNLTPPEFQYALLAHGQIDLAQKRELLELHSTSFFASSAILDVYCSAMKLAVTDDPVLIQGESGTGKEVLAQYIHRHSGRGANLFVPVNVAAMPEKLVDAELFGHERGAFTGAEQLKQGYFEQVGKGTVFLDEIGDMPEEHQIRLLRVLQERQFRRVGGAVFIPFDGRVILATHRNLQKRIEENRFREDLFNRLTLKLTLPPLRERFEEIIPLAEHFLAEITSELGKQGIILDKSAHQRLLEYEFPGNVRELAAIMRVVGIGVGNNRLVRADDLPLPVQKLKTKLSICEKDLPEKASDTCSSQTFEELTLARVEQIIRTFCVEFDDVFLPGIKPKIEQALQRLLSDCAIQCLKRCRHPISQKLRLLPAMQLLTGNKDLKGTGAKRLMNEILRRKQDVPVTMADLESLCNGIKRKAQKTCQKRE